MGKSSYSNAFNNIQKATKEKEDIIDQADLNYRGKLCSITNSMNSTEKIVEQLNKLKEEHKSDVITVGILPANPYGIAFEHEHGKWKILSGSKQTCEKSMKNMIHSEYDRENETTRRTLEVESKVLGRMHRDPENKKKTYRVWINNKLIE